jgi:hypothetical protein
MKTPFKKIIFVISLVFNILIILLFSLASISPKPIRFTLGSFSDRYLHSALIVSVPWYDTDITFGPVEIVLKRGALAALQFSMIGDDALQTNMAIEPLYDPGVIKTERTGYGINIYAINAGETTLQIFSNGSFHDIARILVYEE